MSIEIYPKKQDCFCANAQKVLFLNKKGFDKFIIINKSKPCICAFCTDKM